MSAPCLSPGASQGAGRDGRVCGVIRDQGGELSLLPRQPQRRPLTQRAACVLP